MDLTQKAQLIEYLQSHGLYTQKKLGQNFLVDRDALSKIIEAAELTKNDCVIEVGPGLGVLTEELVGRAGKVVAVELDKRLAGLLEERLAYDSSMFEVINGDILRINLTDVVRGYRNYKVVANIPYYITSKILRLFLEAENKPEMIVMLTQKEVAERVCAKPGDMSLLSVSVQAYGDPAIVDIVPRDSFFPAPEVNSAILKIQNIESRIRDIDEKSYFRCVHVGFASRRKTLLNNLSAGYRLEKETVLGILRQTGLSENVRAQELSVNTWKVLCRAINANLKFQNSK